MLDAGAAVRAAAGVQARITVTPATVLPGQPVTLSAIDSILPSGRTIDAYQWALVDDGGIVPALGTSTDPSITVTPTAPGSFTVSLTVTDSQGVVSAESVTVPVAGGASSGGGGALGGVGLLGLLAALGLLSVGGHGSSTRSRAGRR